MRNFTLAIFFIGMVVLVDVIGIVVLAARGSSIPDVLANVAVAGIAAMAGLLARPSSVTPPNP